MQKTLLALSLFVWVTSASAQKVVYDANAEVRTAKNFHAIKVSGGIDLYLVNGEEAIAVSASEPKYRERIKTVVENGILNIWYDYEEKNKVIFTSQRKLKAYVSFRKLDMLSASGGCDIMLDGTIKGNSFALSISGGSDFEGKVSVQDLKIDQSGGSDIDISGNANRVVIEASGGSDFDGYGLVTETCSIEASGGSDVHITVNKDLGAKASGGSDVLYKGAAAVKENKSGGSVIKKMGR
ncbi:MAG: head GIN domain-containing protein [Chitinophagaceae bacterium]